MILDGINYEMFVNIEYLKEIGALSLEDIINSDHGLYFNAFIFLYCSIKLYY